MVQKCWRNALEGAQLHEERDKEKRQNDIGNKEDEAARVKKKYVNLQTVSVFTVIWRLRYDTASPPKEK